MHEDRSLLEAGDRLQETTKAVYGNVSLHPACTFHPTYITLLTEKRTVALFFLIIFIAAIYVTLALSKINK